MTYADPRTMSDIERMWMTWREKARKFGPDYVRVTRYLRYRISRLQRFCPEVRVASNMSASLMEKELMDALLRMQAKGWIT